VNVIAKANVTERGTSGYCFNLPRRSVFWIRKNDLIRGAKR
jgi:hypothetical protein